MFKDFFFTNNVDMFKGPITKWPLHQNTRKTKPEVTDIYKHQTSVSWDPIIINLVKCSFAGKLLS